MRTDTIKRLRVIAGPNGSGKSTLCKLLKLRVPTEPFVNADHIAKWLLERGVINLLSTFGITSDPASFQQF